jgi:hypothetical protein
MFPPPRGLIFGGSRHVGALPGVPPADPRGNTMKLPRRQFLQLTGAAIAVPAVGRISPVAAEPAPRQVETLAIKREEIQHCCGASVAQRVTLPGN